MINRTLEIHMGSMAKVHCFCQYDSEARVRDAMQKKINATWKQYFPLNCYGVVLQTGETIMPIKEDE